MRQLFRIPRTDFLTEHAFRAVFHPIFQRNTPTKTARERKLSYLCRVGTPTKHTKVFSHCPKRKM